MKLFKETVEYPGCRYIQAVAIFTDMVGTKIF